MRRRSCRLWTGALSAIALIAAVAGSAQGSSGSPTASRVLNPRAGVHIAPTHRVAQSLGVARAGFAGGPLSYHSGPVMVGPTRAIPIFWEPANLQNGHADNIDASYNSLLKRFFADVGGSGLYDNLTQYYESSSPHIYIVNGSGSTKSILDTRPYPAAGAACSANGLKNCITNTQMQAEIQKVINARSLKANYSTFYPLFTGKGEATCFDKLDCFDPLTSTNWVYCGYHTWFPLNGNSRKPVIWAMLPYIDYNGSSVAGCDTSASPPTPNGDLAFDAETPVTSHELNEALTDPLASGGWYDNTGMEVADICDNNSVSTLTWRNGHKYVVQSEYSNTATGCVYGGSESISLTQTSGVAGSSTTVNGSGFANGATVDLWFTDSSGKRTGGPAYNGLSPIVTATADGTGAFSQAITIPASARNGAGILDAANAGAPEDGASATFTVTEFQPDGQIGPAKSGPFTGDNVYNTTGTGQKLTRQIGRGKRGSFWVEIQNDGNTSDAITVHGLSAAPGFTVAYRFGTNTITSAVEAGTYQKTIAAGSRIKIEMIVGVKASAPVGRVFDDKVTLTSVSDSTKKDAVIAEAKAK